MMFRRFFSAPTSRRAVGRPFCRLHCERLEERRLLTTYLVNTTADPPIPPVGSCIMPNVDCTLRAAITQANQSNGDTIDFHIVGAAPHTITLTGALPAITAPTVIDGTSQPDFSGTPNVEVTGVNAGAGVSGLVLQSGGDTIRGLVLNRFDQYGIRVQGGSRNVIAGNYIGTDVFGIQKMGNGAGGILLSDSANNTIGGTNAQDRNLISGNGAVMSNVRGIDLTGTGSSGNQILGNFIGTNRSGSLPLGNASDGIIIDGASNNLVQGNVISGNGFSGLFIYDSGASGNVVRGNDIGTDVTGSQPLGNAALGVDVQGAPNNVIGGTDSGGRNVISANGTAGVVVTSGPGPASGNVVEGNYVGTNADGTAGLGGQDYGVWVEAVSNVTVGGTAAGAGNLLSGNGFAGVELDDFAGPTNGNTVQGNFIGTDRSGTTALSNGQYGVYVFGACSGNLIGGNTAAARNVISANNADGVYLEGSGATQNRIDGNFIGTDRSGTQPLGNGGAGVMLLNAPGNIVGGTGPEESNVISANGSSGVFLQGGGTTNNLVLNNRIGTDVTGTAPLGNGSQGVYIDLGASANMIGQSNTIAFNGNDGVLADSGIGNGILGNSIFSNGNLGIELTGNANLQQSFPTLTVISSNGVLTVAGVLNSIPNLQLRVEYFGSSFCDPSGFGEGQTYLGYQYVIADGFGNATFATQFSVSTAFVTATATDPVNDTSEFSACAPVPPGSAFRANGGGGSVAVAAFGLVKPVESGAPVEVPASMPDRPLAPAFEGLRSEPATEADSFSPTPTTTKGPWAAPHLAPEEAGWTAVFPVDELLGVPALSY
jgi:titin